MGKYFPRFHLCFLLVVAGSTALSGCPEEPGDTGNATGATCDPAIAYEDDVAPFLRAYCTDCHASSLPAPQRRGAPTDHDFDSESALLAYPLHVIDYAGAGPSGQNTAMPPPGLPQPTLAERHLLAAFLTCYQDGGLPEHTHDGGGH